MVRADVLRVSDMTFFAQLVTASNGTERTFDCRPSDAINLALRSAAPIAVAKVVFDDVRSEEGSDVAR